MKFDWTRAAVKTACAAAAFAAMVAGSSGLAAAADISGTWTSQSGETRVKVAPCGADLCGTIVWTKDGGKDVNNPDASKRDRSLVGVRMMWGIKAGGSGYSGSLYDYKSGKTYSGKMALRGANALELSGCVLGGLICRSQTWTRSN